MRVAPDYLSQMRTQYAYGVYYREALGTCVVGLICGNPYGGNSKSRLARLHAFERRSASRGAPSRMNRELAIRD